MGVCQSFAHCCPEQTQGREHFGSAEESRHGHTPAARTHPISSLWCFPIQPSDKGLKSRCCFLFPYLTKQLSYSADDLGVG